MNRPDTTAHKATYDSRPVRWRVATCDEYGCRRMAEGFYLAFPLSHPNESAMSATVRQGDRRFAELLFVEDGPRWALNVVSWGPVGSSEVRLDPIRQKVTDDLGEPARVFAFPVGERCFLEHRVPEGAPLLQHANGARHQVAAERSLRAVQAPEFLERLHEDTDKASEARRREGVGEMKGASDG